MDIKKDIVVILGALALFGTILLQRREIRKLMYENERQRGNSEALLSDMESYRTKGSLSAATIGSLRLTIEEFEKYRQEDAALIKTLRVKNRDLQNVATVQARTINDFRDTFRDSVVYLPGDTVTTVLRCISACDTWYELSGCEGPDGAFLGRYVSRDSLLIISTVKYRRFLGFLWKTRRVRDRKVDVVSRNPNSEIIGVEFIEVE